MSDIKILETTLQDVSPRVLINEMKTFAIELHTTVKRLLHEGIDMPIVGGLNFEDSQISFHKKYVQIEANVRNETKKEKGPKTVKVEY